MTSRNDVNDTLTLRHLFCFWRDSVHFNVRKDLSPLRKLPSYANVIYILYNMPLTGNGGLTSAVGQSCSCCATVCSCRTLRSSLAAALRQTKDSRKFFARLPCGLRETNARLNDSSPTLTPCIFVGQSCVHLEAALRLPCDLRTSSKNRKEKEHVENSPYDVATALRPCEP